LTVGSLFAGIGGFDLGFERAGFKVKWQVEIDPFCRAELVRRWPDVKRYEDVQEVHGEGQGYWYVCGESGHCADCLERVDVIVGGFPCQDISHAGAGAGLAGARSGLWREFARIISALRPRYVVVENVAALLERGMGTVLGDLADLGYDAVWDCVRASDFGADHERNRLFIVAFSQSSGRPVVLRRDGRECVTSHPAWEASASLDSPVDRAKRIESWLCEPAILGGLDGLSSKLVERALGAYGNSVMPQIAEWIARRILEAETAADEAVTHPARFTPVAEGEVWGSATEDLSLSSTVIR
jgi:DNA (cytosine-5)-methyltransferase 1